MTKFFNSEARPKLFVGDCSIACSYSAFLRSCRNFFSIYSSSEVCLSMFFWERCCALLLSDVAELFCDELVCMRSKFCGTLATISVYFVS